MGLKVARKQFIEALRQGNFRTIERLDDPQKNLLATGEVEPEDVVDLIARTKGQEYEEQPNQNDPGSTVHIWKPTKDQVRWYIKAFFKDAAWFISVHPSSYNDENS